MGNKAILLVAGLSIVFVSIGSRLLRVTGSAYQKYVDYISYQQATLAAESAANIALSNARITPRAAFGVSDAKIYPVTPNDIDCSISIVKRILADSVIHITAVSEYNNIQCTTEVRMFRPSFADYAMYTEKMTTDDGKPIYWITGDTCRGKFHTQDYLYVSGKPVFTGMVTTKMGVIKRSPSDAPDFQGGINERAADHPLTAENLNETKKAGELGGAVYNGVNTYIQFLADGRIVVRLGSNGWNENRTNVIEPITKKPYCVYYKNVSELTTTGVVLVNNARVHIRGVLNGKMTIGSFGSGSSVWIDSSVVYEKPPLNANGYANWQCDDMLGIVAENAIRISEGAENNGIKPKGVTIHAALFSLNDGLGADMYNTRGVDGTLRVIGGIHTKKRVPVGTFSGNTITSGFQKDYWYDNRMIYETPIAYPRSTHYVIDNWLDKTIFPDEFWQWF